MFCLSCSTPGEPTELWRRFKRVTQKSGKKPIVDVQCHRYLLRLWSISRLQLDKTPRYLSWENPVPSASRRLEFSYFRPLFIPLTFFYFALVPLLSQPIVCQPIMSTASLLSSVNMPTMTLLFLNTITGKLPCRSSKTCLCRFSSTCCHGVTLHNHRNKAP